MARSGPRRNSLHCSLRRLCVLAPSRFLFPPDGIMPQTGEAYARKRRRNEEGPQDVQEAPEIDAVGRGFAARPFAADRIQVADRVDPAAGRVWEGNLGRTGG